MTRVLVWHWGRRGAGPRYAAQLTAALDALPGVTALLSLAEAAEILRGADAPPCALPFRTYRGLADGALRLPMALAGATRLARQLRAMRPDVAICAMPALLDPAMVRALNLARIPYAAILHDADTHPGEHALAQKLLRRSLARNAAGVVALSRHVGHRLLDLGLADRRRLIMGWHPPLAYGLPPPPPLAHGGRLRLLFFGRLLPYKGIDLLADAIGLLGTRSDYELRIAGSGPNSADLDRLRRSGAQVSNAWVPEAEVPTLLAWADALVLSHREASQSGVAAAALAAGRWIAATEVGGLAEQLRNEPGALLCASTPEALAATLVRLIEAPPPPIPPADAAAQWRDAASHLLAEIAKLVGLALPAPPPQPTRHPEIAFV